MQKAQKGRGGVTKRSDTYAGGGAHMEFVKNFTQPDFQAKNFTPQKRVVSGEIYTAGKILHCRREWQEWQIPTLSIVCPFGGEASWSLKMV